MDYVIGAKMIVDLIKGVADGAYSLWTCAWDMQIKEILNDLETSMNELKIQRNGVLERVTSEESRLQIRILRVRDWLNEVDRVEQDVADILRDGRTQLDRRCLRGCCPINCWASYNVGRAVTKIQPLVNELKQKGVFDAVTEPRPPLPFQPVPVDPNVGSESTLETAWSFFGNADVGIMGLYGMPGVGKSTLLRKINNEFEKRTHDFDVVVLVEISREVDRGRIVKAIGDKLGLPKSVDTDTGATQIFNALRTKKFVILLDDIWNRLDLNFFGIPHAERGSKIVFTTRNELVCGWMNAHKKLRVECLSKDEAWTLFQTKVGEGTLKCHPDIKDVAIKVAERCGGLPLALIVIGGTMKSKTMLSDWRNALKELQKQKFQEMGEDVFRLSKISYDKLPSEDIRKCFLFCSLYPEGQSIFKDDLIKRWIGKGFIEMDSVDDWNAAVDTGDSIVRTLKEAGLLESHEERARDVVKMHDVVRDLALWIACECGKETDKYLVESSELTVAPVTSKWKRAHCISMSYTKIKELRDIPDCPKLSILLLSDNIFLMRIHDDYFNHLHALTYLDLSKSGTTKLPKSIGELSLLECLDVSDTDVQELPCEMKKLVNLMYLFLAHMKKVPGSLITHLSKLKLLKFNERNSGDVEGRTQSSVSSNDNRKALRITNSNAEALKFLLHRGLIHCAVPLSIEFEVDQDPAIIINTTMISPASSSNCEQVSRSCISNLIVYWEWDVKERSGPCFRNLHSVSISSCSLVVNIAWVLDVPNIEYLQIESCRSFKEIIPVDSEERDAFSKLRRLVLIDLPCLLSICGNTLPFPYLEQIEVTKCPKLRELPLDLSSAANNNRLSILGDKEWWNNLVWKNGAVKTKFSSFFSCPIVCPVFVINTL